MSKTRASCFIKVPDTSKQMKARGRRPRAFIYFEVSGARDEALAFAFDILLLTSQGCKMHDRWAHVTTI